MTLDGHPRIFIPGTPRKTLMNTYWTPFVPFSAFFLSGICEVPIRVLTGNLLELAETPAEGPNGQCSKNADVTLKTGRG